MFVGETVRIRDVDALVNYASVGEKVITAVTTTAPHTFTVAVATGTTAEVTVTGLVENKVPQTSLGQVRYLRLETRATAL